MQEQGKEQQHEQPQTMFYYENDEEKYKMITQLRDTIQEMKLDTHRDIFKILKKNDIPYSENTNGIFVNLSELKDQVVEEIQKYIQYIETQEKEIQDIENQKKEYEDKYFQQE